MKPTPPENVTLRDNPSAVTTAIALLVILLLLVARRPHAAFHPQLFAEDGVVFWIQDYLLGGAAIFKTYGGYFHLVPRTIAYLSSFFDPKFAPTLFYLLSLVSHLGLALLILSRRVRLPLRPVIACLTVLVPHTGEVFTNATNTNWPLALGLLTLALSDDAQTICQRLSDRAILFVTGLSGPFSLFLLPCYLFRALYRRTRESWVLAAFALLIAGVQAVALLRTEIPISGNNPDYFLSFSVLSFRLWKTLVAGYSIPNASASWSLIVSGGAATLFFLALSLRPGRWREARIQIALAWFCLSAAVGAKFYREAVFLTASTAGDRYFYLPHVLALWWLMIEFTMTTELRRWYAVAGLSLCVLMGYDQFVEPPRKTLPWEAEMTPVREGRKFSIPTLPEAWVISSPGKIQDSESATPQ